jgi:hypothetical protein
VILVLAIANNFHESWEKKEFPHFLVLVTTYLAVFSSIPHKEDRFLLPIYPFLFLILSQFMVKLIKIYNQYEKYILRVFFLLILYEIFLTLAFIKYEQVRFKPLEDIMKWDPNPY